MAGRGAQTFKKRQKEQQRKEKQQEKLARRIERKQHGLGAPIATAEDIADLQGLGLEDLSDTDDAVDVEAASPEVRH